VAGVLIRGATWFLSAATIGPVLGFLDTAAGTRFDRREILFAQAILTVLTVIAAVVCGVGLLTDPGRYRRPVRLLCYLLIADSVIYLVPLVIAATLPVDVTTSAWVLFVVAVIGNLALAGLCTLIATRSRRLKPAPVPVPIELSI
jgi:hypothetical protein